MMAEDPFRRMLRDMEETLKRFQTETGVLGGPLRAAVPVDVEEDGDHLVVRADIPGVEKDRIQVSASRDTLEIGAEDAREVREENEHYLREENEHYLRQERSKRRLQRTLRLPVPVDPDAADAEYENGVLTVRLRKPDGARRRDIDIS